MNDFFYDLFIKGECHDIFDPLDGETHSTLSGLQVFSNILESRVGPSLIIENDNLLIIGGMGKEGYFFKVLF